MSADQKFLDSLKPGSQFVLRNRRLDTFGRRHGPQIYEVVKITPKRTKFTVRRIGSTEEFDIKGHGTHVVGGGFGREWFPMLPYSQDIDAEMARNTAFIVSKNRASRMEGNLHLFERLEEIDHERVEEFLRLSHDLDAFLRKMFPKTEV